MDLIPIIRSGNGKNTVQQIIQVIESDPTLFDQLMHIVQHGEFDLSRKAAWPMSYLAIDHPEWIKKYYPIVIDLLEAPNLHPAIARNCFRFLQFAKIPKKYSAVLFGLSMVYLDNPKIAVAIRAFAMSTALVIVKSFPELRFELEATINKHLNYGTSGFKNRGYKVLNELEKLTH